MMVDFNFCCSKLRLDYLMSNDYRVKNQFTVMDHIGVPNHDPQQVSLSLLFYLTLIVCSVTVLYQCSNEYSNIFLQTFICVFDSCNFCPNISKYWSLKITGNGGLEGTFRQHSDSVYFANFVKLYLYLHLLEIELTL